jgi:hypothetical protein
MKRLDGLAGHDCRRHRNRAVARISDDSRPAFSENAEGYGPTTIPDKVQRGSGRAANDSTMPSASDPSIGEEETSLLVDCGLFACSQVEAPNHDSQ